LGDGRTVEKKENITMETLKNKKILITGGTGSIGSEIVRQVLKQNPAVIRILSRDDTKQFELEQELGPLPNVRFFIGDVRNKSKVIRAAENIDIIFHAAAMKHVPACERNPYESVLTNVHGTQNVIEAALSSEVEKVIFISTDKAANASNTMGVTKLLAEKLMVNANLCKGPRKTIFSCTRFGNVLNSRGSVVPLFEKQIRSGGPLTITIPEMTRFVMTIPQAVNLVLKAEHIAKGGEVFIFKMPVIKIIDLVQAMDELLTLTATTPRKIIGAREGEMLHESLMNKYECQHLFETDDMFIFLTREIMSQYHKNNYPGVGTKIESREYSSEYVIPLSVKEIKEVLTKDIYTGNYNKC